MPDPRGGTGIVWPKNGHEPWSVNPTKTDDSVDESRFGTAMTLARNLQVACVGLYLVSGKSILAKATTLARVDDMSKTKASTVALAALKISTSEPFLETMFPNA